MDGTIECLNLIFDLRQYLRITHESFDGEIADLINAARTDLLDDGILPAKVNDPDDALIKRAIVSYVKAEFGIDNPDADKYRTVYQSLKTHLMLSVDYVGADETETEE